MSSDTDPHRRRVLKGIGGIAIGSAIAGCIGGGDGSSEQISYDATHGIVETELNQIPSLAALDTMLPEVSDDRLGGSWRTFRNSSLPMQAMIAGEIDYYALSFGNVVQATLSGNDVVTLGPKNVGTDYQWVIREDIEAKTLEELVNGDYVIGVAGLGGLSHTQVAGVLQQEGLPTDPKEAGIQSIGGSGARTSAIAAGKIDATIIHIDQVKRIQAEGAPVRVLFDLRKYYPNFVAQAFTVKREWLESEEGQAHVKNYMDVLLEAHELATNNFDWVFKHTERIMAETLDEEDARKSWEFNANVLKTWAYTKDSYQNEDFQKYVDALNAAGVLSDEEYEQVTIDEILNHDYWNEAASDRNTDRWSD